MTFLLCFVFIFLICQELITYHGNAKLWDFKVSISKKKCRCKQLAQATPGIDDCIMCKIPCEYTDQNEFEYEFVLFGTTLYFGQFLNKFIWYGIRKKIANDVNFRGKNDFSKRLFFLATRIRLHKKKFSDMKLVAFCSINSNYEKYQFLRKFEKINFYLFKYRSR